MVDDLSVQTKTERNKRVQARYDELMREGKHGHYETMFRVVREEVDAALDLAAELVVVYGSTSADLARQKILAHRSEGVDDARHCVFIP